MSENIITSPIPIELGGTNSSTAADAIKSLGGSAMVVSPPI